MELRQPPTTAPPARRDGLLVALLILNVLGLASVAAVLWLGSGRGGDEDLDLTREVAGKLKAAGALDEAAALYERYLDVGDTAPETRAKIAYSLGTTYLDRGQSEKALRWFYLAESLGTGGLEAEVGEKIVHTLERMGRIHAAQAALESRVSFSGEAATGTDPVVARIGDRDLLRSEVQAALDDLPPEAASQVQGREGQEAFLRSYVAQELIWRKAQKLEYDEDPVVLRQHAALLKQLAVSRFVERELATNVSADSADVQNFFTANRERYAASMPEGEEPDFERLRPLVERDYRMAKIEASYTELIEQELSASGVELFPERMVDAAP